ncbi:MAG: bifunctional protein-serine/threonine kinase/phosphatase [Magnetococcales bacterium]|nr:bifunctional protein-serine/threonine kinase/phosphatase [Magnetococcales bacterium]
MDTTTYPTHPELRIGQASRAGRRHPRNDDFYGVAQGSGRHRDWGTLVCVADGIGGSADGRMAAETTIRALLGDYFGTSLGWRGIRALYAVTAGINDWLYRQGMKREGGLGTTLVAALFRDRTLSVLAAGDTRLYLWREGRLRQLTRDHLFGDPELSILTKAVGLDDRFTPDLLEELLLEGDRYLLLSDGVWRELADERIRQWVAQPEDPQAIVEGMMTEAAKAGVDDATAVVVEVLRLPPPRISGLKLAWRDIPVGIPPGVGAEVDGFRIEQILQKGMQGVVTLALDRERQSLVVLKFPDPLAAGDPAWLEGFVREEWIGLQVRHDNVVKALPLPEGRRRVAYHALEYLEGRSLEVVRRERGRRGVTAVEIVAWLRQVARGALALHRKGIIHRDIKPDNLILTDEGRVVVIDFGSALVTGLEGKPEAFSGRRIAGGSSGFMAPELYRGDPGGPAADIFALGVTGYLLLSGRFPYGEPEPHMVPTFAPPVPLAVLRPDLPPALTAVIERCLAIKPADRPGDLGELSVWLEQPELLPPAGDDRALLTRDPLGFYRLGFWFFLLSTLALLLLRLSG